MALKIKQIKDVFMVEGTIISDTVKQFKNHLEFLIIYSKALTINIDAVTSIDKDGMKAIEELYKMALTYKKPFTIVGYGCKEIYEDILVNDAA
ncbi:STAS domain-containing protein [Tamlana crocina]